MRRATVDFASEGEGQVVLQAVEDGETTAGGAGEGFGQVRFRASLSMVTGLRAHDTKSIQ